MSGEIEQRWRELGEFIREQRRDGHLSLRKLADLAGVSNPYLSQIERGLRKPSAEILQQIANALHISAETLYVQAGILEPRDSSFNLVAEIHRDPHLSEEQKKTLVHIYESFRAGSPGPSAPDREPGEEAESYTGSPEASRPPKGTPGAPSGPETATFPTDGAKGEEQVAAP